MDPKNNLHERLSQIIFGDSSLTEVERRFLHAAEKGDFLTLQDILDKNAGLNVNCVDYLGRSAIQLAVVEEHTEIIDYLIPRLQPQKVGESWLDAIDRGNLTICEQILNHPVNKNTRIKNQLLGNDSFFSTETENLRFSADMSPIILASHRNNVKLIQLLLANGAVIPRPHAYDCKCTSCSNQRTFDSVRHSRSRLNAYKGLASASYMSLSSADPLKTAFELSKELAELSKVEKEFKTEYVNLSDQCKDYCVELENLCRSTNELITLLQGKSSLKSKSNFGGNIAPDTMSNIDAFSAEDIDGAELNMLKIAIKTKQKKFIAHPSCQQQLSNFWYRGFPFWQHSHFLMKAIIVILMTIFLPLIVLTYYVVPYKGIKRWLQSPIMKFVMHVMSHIVFLLLLGLLSVRNDQLFRQALGLPPLNMANLSLHLQKEESQYLYLFSIIHLLVVLWVIGFLVNEVTQIYEEGPMNYLVDWWNYLDFNLCLFYIAAYTTLFTIYFRINKEISLTSFQQFLADIEGRNGRRAPSLETPIAIFNVFFSFANVMSFIRMAYFLPANEQVGPLQISLGRMVEDVIKFGFILILVIMAFICAMTNLYGMYSREGSNNFFTSLEGTFRILYWSTFGMGDPNAPKFDGSQRVLIQNAGYILYGAYVATSVVVLINMLIAMMTDSFEEIKQDEDVEWKYARTRLWMSFIQEKEFLPVPFNIIPSPSFFKIIPNTVAQFIKYVRNKMLLKSSMGDDAKLFNKNRNLATGLNRENFRDGIMDEKYDIIMRKIIRRFLHSILYSGVQQNEGESLEVKYSLLKSSNEKMKNELIEIKNMLADMIEIKYPNYLQPRRSFNVGVKDNLKFI